MRVTKNINFVIYVISANKESRGKDFLSRKNYLIESLISESKRKCCL